MPEVVVVVPGPSTAPLLLSHFGTMGIGSMGPAADASPPPLAVGDGAGCRFFPGEAPPRAKEAGLVAEAPLPATFLPSDGNVWASAACC